MTSRLDRLLQRHFITSDDIRSASLRGETTVAVRENSTVTDEARELAMKLAIRLAMPGQPRPPEAAAPVDTPRRAPDDTGGRVADAIAAVLNELKLGDRASSLVPVLTRRVFAGLTKPAGRS